MVRRKHRAGAIIFGVLVALFFISVSGVVVAQDTININGDFGGDLDGYEEDNSDPSHMIAVEGEFTVSGEAAQDVTITIASDRWTVLDTATVEPFVEGERDITFDRQYQPDEVRLHTDEIPSGTTVLIEFETVFVGGTTSDSIDAGTVTVDYETPGGTEGEETFAADTDASASADNRIDALESTDQLVFWQEILSYVGILAIIFVVLKIVLSIARDEDDNSIDI